MNIEITDKGRAYLATPSGWQDIATAPRDGTEILVWRWDCGILLARYTAPSAFMTDTEIERAIADYPGGDNEWIEAEDWFCADFIEGSRMDGSETPTHWMPLPEPPK